MNKKKKDGNLVARHRDFTMIIFKIFFFFFVFFWNFDTVDPKDAITEDRKSYSQLVEIKKLCYFPSQILVLDSFVKVKK